MTYEQLLDSADQEGLAVKEVPLSTHDGLIRDKCIAIRKDIPTQVKKAWCPCRRVRTSLYQCRKHLRPDRGREYKTRTKSPNVGLQQTDWFIRYITAYKYGCQNLHEMAEHLDVTETFLKDTLDAYLLKYGKYTVIDNYMIFFEPLGVVDMNYGIE